jgi:hypothetical protein
MQELLTEDPKGFQNFLRMDKTDFQELLAKVTPHIQRQDTWMREAISAAERFSITLRYLATGDSYHSLEYQEELFLSKTQIQKLCELYHEEEHLWNIQSPYYHKKEKRNAALSR